MGGDEGRNKIVIHIVLEISDFRIKPKWLAKLTSKISLGNKVILSLFALRVVQPCLLSSFVWGYSEIREVFVFKSLDLLFTYIIVFEQVCASHWCHLFPWWLVIFETFFEMIYLTAKQLISVDAGNSIIPNLWTFFVFFLSFRKLYSLLHSCIIYLKFVLFSKRDTFIFSLLCPSSWT